MIDRYAEIEALHDDAMAIADRGDLARRRGDNASAQVFYAQALEQEQKAATLLSGDLDFEPTRSILYRSAASLAVDCDEVAQAERLIGAALAGNPPSEIRAELLDLLEQATYARHFELKPSQLAVGKSGFQMTLVGQAVGFGIVRAEEFVVRVASVEKMLRRTAERLQNRPFRTTKEPKELKAQFSLNLAAPQAASFAVPMDFRRYGGQLTFDGFDDNSHGAVVKEVLDCLELMENKNEEGLNERIPDADYFTNFVGLARQIMADGTDIQTVGFTTVAEDGLGTRVVQLTNSIKQIPLTSKNAKAEESTTRKGSSVGQLRAASSVQSNTITIVPNDKGKSLKIYVLEGMAEIVKPFFEETVEVSYEFRERKPWLLDIVQVIEN